jgi:hypothetical protein
LDQWLLYPTADGKLDGRVVRRLHLSSEAKYCVADDASGALYVAQQAVGIWRYDADPEAEPVPTIVDINRLGHIAGEVGGLAILNGGKGADYLVAVNADSGDYNVYDRSADDRFLGPSRSRPTARRACRVRLACSASARRSAHRLPAGALLIADDRKAGANSKIVSWKDVAAALKVSPGQDAPTVAPSKLALVQATMETQPVSHGGDAADDPAIYVHPTDPAKSAIIATDKKGGMLVYDLSGKLPAVPARRQDEQCRPAPRLQAGRQERHPGHGQRPDPQGHCSLHDRSRHPPADQRRRRRPGHAACRTRTACACTATARARPVRLHQRSRRPGPPVEAGRHAGRQGRAPSRCAT